MARIALGLEYDGSAFAGWQSQAHARGIQAEVERALSFVADQSIEVTAAGRTDAGVHALLQVVHFDTSAERSDRSWTLGANSRLPADVTALWACRVPEGFHARYSAVARRYRYRILNRPTRPALERYRVGWVREPLDERRMREAALHLIGEHDFSSFRASECQSRTPMRRVDAIDIDRSDHQVTIDITANAFLHHMVRNIVGVLIAIGAGDRDPDWARQVLEARDRRQGGFTARPEGLYLASIRYAPELGLPSLPRLLR